MLTGTPSQNGPQTPFGSYPQTPQQAPQSQIKSYFRTPQAVVQQTPTTNFQQTGFAQAPLPMSAAQPFVQPPAPPAESHAIPSLYDSLEKSFPQQSTTYMMSAPSPGTPMSVSTTPVSVKSANTPSMSKSTSHRVTVFGFPSDETQKVLSRFLKLGRITRYWFSFNDESDETVVSENAFGDGNWVHLEYESAYLAGLALTKNGSMMDGYMIGVVSYKPLAELQRATSTTPRMSKMSQALLGSTGRSPRVSKGPRSSPYQPTPQQQQHTPWKEPSVPDEGVFKKPLMKQVGEQKFDAGEVRKDSVRGYEDVFNTPIQPVRRDSGMTEASRQSSRASLPRAPMYRDETDEAQPSSGSVVNTFMERLFGWG
jgi:hypothetical protein